MTNTIKHSKIIKTIETQRRFKISKDQSKHSFVKKLFIEELADLCEYYKDVTFGYTNDDDGIHITVCGEIAFVGFLESDVPGELRAALKTKSPMNN